MARHKIILELTPLEHQVLARAALTAGAGLFEKPSERAAYTRAIDKLYSTRPRTAIAAQ